MFKRDTICSDSLEYVLHVSCVAENVPLCAWRKYSIYSSESGENQSTGSMKAPGTFRLGST